MKQGVLQTSSRSTKARLLINVLFVLIVQSLSAQSTNDWENQRVFAINRTAHRATFVPYESTAEMQSDEAYQRLMNNAQFQNAVMNIMAKEFYKSLSIETQESKEDK